LHEGVPALPAHLRAVRHLACPPLLVAGEVGVKLELEDLPSVLERLPAGLGMLVEEAGDDRTLEEAPEPIALPIVDGERARVPFVPLEDLQGAHGGNLAPEVRKSLLNLEFDL